MFKPLLLAGLLLGVTVSPIMAQQPTQEQRDAIRASCRSDFMANCSGVQPGGKDALECLKRNHAKLSATCKAAVAAIAAPAPSKPPAAAAPASSAPAAAEPTAKPAAAAPAPSQADQIKAVRKACTLDDIAAHCSWIAPGNPEIVLCLQANATDLSPACQSAVGALPPAAVPKAVEAPAPAAAPPKKPPAPARAAAAPPPAPAAAPVITAKPTAQQTSAIRAACRSDFMSRCSGVTPGGAAALQCLQRNAARLSPACRSAVAVIGAPAGGEAAAPQRRRGNAGRAPLALPPFMLPRKRLLLVAICQADAQSLCAGSAAGRRPRPRLPCGQRVKLVAELLRRARPRRRTNKGPGGYVRRPYRPAARLRSAA